MKKLLLFLITLTFLAVSCGSSKKAENDTDILPDEDAVDADGIEENSDLDEEASDDEDNNDELNDTDEDETEDIDPCEPNPCEDFANTDGKCKVKKDGSFECGCIEGYFWGHLGCKKITFANICTGQEDCYDIYSSSPEQKCPSEYSVWYGQDARYAEMGYCLNKDFQIDRSAENEPTHKNDTLQLEWSQPDKTLLATWEDAVKYCDDLQYGGHDDWRLPLPKELQVIVKFLTDLSGDLSTKKLYWSSMTLPENRDLAWFLNAHLYIDAGSKTSKFNIRCTRGDDSPFLESKPEDDRFEIINLNGKEVILDSQSGIIWQNEYSKEYDWTDAMVHCERSEYAGFSDWRMPNMYELSSLINYKYEGLAEFPLTEKLSSENSTIVWSSTTNPFSGSPSAYGIDFATGKSSSFEKRYVYGHALCMRNEPCKKGFWWNGEKCVKNPCENNPCKNMEHSDGICGTEDFKGYFCGCDENYFWDGEECAKNPCEPNPCGDYEHTTGECSAPNRITFICSCEESYWWWGKNDGCVKERPHQRRVCTGQTKCYDMEKEITCPDIGEDFYGQDAQYAALGFCVPQNYAVDDSYEDEPIVTDINTGLEWQQKSKPVDHISWSTAQAYCDNLDYGGYSDWRLPTFYELQTLINYDGSPTIDTKYFPDTPPENFWSSTSIYSGAAIVDFENAGLSSASLGISSSVRCVRGEVFEEDRGSLHTVSYEDGFLYTNTTTNLIWTRFTPEYYYEKNTWQERMKYCEDLEFAGFSDWRLPNVHELNSISLEDRWLRYGSSSTSMPWHPAEHFADASYKDETDHYYVCIRENPCTDGKLWDHGKCVSDTCVPNPCEEIENSYGGCGLDSSTELGFICGCNDGYLWDGTLVKCVFKTDRCNPNPCLEVENSTGECLQPGPYEQKCVCAEGYRWDGWNDICVKDSDILK